MPKPSLRKKENAAVAEGTPMLIGIASGTRPRFISIATYQDSGKTIAFRSNHFGKRQEIASPVDGTPLTIVDTPQDVSTIDLNSSLTKVGECDHCSSDLYATKATASEIAGLTGHCVMCAQDVTFTAEAASGGEGAETVSTDVNDFADAPNEVAGDSANHFDFSEMELVNIDDEDSEEANMARQNDQKAIAEALRAPVTASGKTRQMDDEDSSEMEGGEEMETESEEESEGEETEAYEAEETEAAEEGEEMEGGEEETDAATSEEPSEGEEMEDGEEEDEFAEDEEEASVTSADAVAPAGTDVSTDTLSTEAPAAPETVMAADVAIDDYQAVDIETVDLSDAVLVPASETAAYVMLGATPALYLNKEAASETVKAVWEKPQTLRHALTAAMKTSDNRQKTLASFGGQVVTVPTTMRAYAKSTLDAYTAKAEAEVASTVQEHSTRYARALNTAALGVVKRSFGPSVVDTITAGLVATFENHGVRNAQAIVLASLRENMPTFLQTVLEQANALVIESDDVLSTTAEMVGNAAYPVELPEPAPIVEQATVSAAPKAAPTPKPVIETATVVKPGAISPSQMQRVVASLGGR